MPSSWKLVRVGDIASLLNGYAFASQGFSTSGGVPLIRIRDLGSKTTEINFVGDFPNQYVVKNGDLLIGMDGDFNVVKWNGGYALLNQRVCKLGSMDASVLCDDFLFHRIIGEIVKINRITAATTVKHLASKDVIRIELQLPPSAEQSKIAEVLTTVDRAIAQTEALIAKQQRIKTGLMQDLLTRGIDEHGQLRSEATHTFKDSSLGRIPVEWEVTTVDQIATIVTGNKDTQDANPSADYPFFVRSQTIERISSYSFEGEAVLTAGDGVGTGKVFHYIKGRFDYHQRVYCMHSFNNGMLGYYFFCYFREHFMERVAQFSAKGSVDSVRRHMIAKMLIPKPRHEEQAEVVHILRNAAECIDDYSTALHKLRSLKTALMQDLLTGKVRVTPLLQPPEAVSA